MAQLLDTALAGFESPAARPMAALIIVHGLAEHAQRYRDLSQTLAARGISCFAYDQRGHGDYPGVRTHVERFAHFVDDLDVVAAAVARRYPGLPIYVWGHSMGSIVAILAALAARPWLRGAITTSNSLEIFKGSLNPLSPVFRFGAKVAPRLRIPLGLDSTRISSDTAVQQAYASDVRIPATASLRLIVEFAAACEQCREGAARVKLPWLVVHGEADVIAPVRGSQVLFERLGSQDKKLVIYPALRHEVHNEKAPDRAAFLQLIGDWIVERAAAPTGSAIKAATWN